MSVFARFLLVAMFLLAGPLKLFNTDEYVDLLLTSYVRLYENCHSTYGIALALHPAVLSVLAPYLVYLTGSLQVLGGLLTVFNKKLGPAILISLLVLFNLVIHNPMNYQESSVESLHHTRMGLMNFWTIGGLLLVLAEERSLKVKID